MTAFNLGLRFLLELCTWLAPGVWAWHYFSGLAQYLNAFLFPLLMILVWGIFNVPKDPSRGGKAPVVVPGKLRLFIELSEFAIGLWAWNASGYKGFSYFLLALLILHHLFLKKRLIWLWRQ